MTVHPPDRWPNSATELVAYQRVLAARAAEVLSTSPWTLGDEAVLGGCYVTFAVERNGPVGGSRLQRAWAAAVAWRPGSSGGAGARGYRDSDRVLKGASSARGPRRASDVEDQAVVATLVSSPYEPGLLALRDGPALEEAVRALRVTVEVLLVDATGLDHPRGAGLAVHLGAATDLPTVGVTHRPLLATGDPPRPVRGERSPVTCGGRLAGYWVCTRSGARPVVAHPGWRTAPETAADVVLRASTGAARTPVPIQEARRAAREARSIDFAP